MKSKKSVVFGVVRLFLVLILPALAAFYVSNNLLKIHYEFQPLIKDNSPAPIKIDPDGILESFLGIDMEFLRYDATLFNNSVSVIGGDSKDYKHEVEIFIKYRESDKEKFPTKFGVENPILENQTRNEVLFNLVQMTFLPNINLKPEVLSDGNERVILNKGTSGDVVIEAQLNILSMIVLYFASLLFEAILIQSYRALYQFILWKY